MGRRRRLLARPRGACACIVVICRRYPGKRLLKLRMMKYRWRGVPIFEALPRYVKRGDGRSEISALRRRARLEAVHKSTPEMPTSVVVAFVGLVVVATADVFATPRIIMRMLFLVPCPSLCAGNSTSFGAPSNRAELQDRAQNHREIGVCLAVGNSYGVRENRRSIGISAKWQRNSMSACAATRFRKCARSTAGCSVAARVAGERHSRERQPRAAAGEEIISGGRRLHGCR